MQTCFQNKINPPVDEIIINERNSDSIKETTDGNYQDIVNNRTMIDLIKDNMSNEKMWNEEVQTILKEQVDFLKNEIIVKNTIIARLMTELYDKCPDSNNTINDDSIPTVNDQTAAQHSNNNMVIDNHVDETTFLDGNYTTSEQINTNIPLPTHFNNNNPFYADAIHNGNVHSNRYAVLDDDLHSGFVDECEKDSICEWSRRKDNMEIRRPPNFINQNPENDILQYNQPRIVPGNSTYANVAAPRRKILILSDSTLGRLQMRLFNNEINDGRAYRKYHPGATPNEMTHYCLHTLKNDKPNVVVINSGTNSIPRDDIYDIGKEIFNIVQICRDHGVKEIYVSGIVFRSQYASKVRDLNSYIESKKLQYDFTFINNDNIIIDDIGKDKLHLNYWGIVKIANNILHEINTLHIS